MSPERYGGPIDPWSPNSLSDIVNGDVAEPDEEEGVPIYDDEHTFEYYGFFIHHQGGGHFEVQYDGRLGRVDEFDAEDFDSVLELVDRLNELLIYSFEMEYQDATEEGRPNMTDWAGPMVTSDQEEVEEFPEQYVYVPR